MRATRALEQARAIAASRQKLATDEPTSSDPWWISMYISSEMRNWTLRTGGSSLACNACATPRWKRTLRCDFLPAAVSMEATPTYYALRVCPRSTADRWWVSARRAAQSAPPAVRRILAGRRRVELTAPEAIAALAWARGLDGWDADALAPLWVYPFDPPGFNAAAS